MTKLEYAAPSTVEFMVMLCVTQCILCVINDFICLYYVSSEFFVCLS